MSAITSQKELERTEQRNRTARRKNQNATEELQKTQRAATPRQSANTKKSREYRQLKGEHMKLIEDKLVSDIEER